VVTKKQRRTQLARARALRRQESLARRAARRRRLQTVGIVVAVLAALLALTVWIATRDDESAVVTGAVDYDAFSAVQPLTATTPIEVSR
jgi:ferric-dicitrate binding protein FerR (iron transport regulator)